MTESNTPANTPANTNDQTKATPFQFGMRHMLLAILALCVWLAFVAHMGSDGGVIGAYVLIFAGSVIAIAIGVSRQAKMTSSIGYFGLTCCVLVICLLPSGGSRAPSLRTECISKVKQITLALQNYHDIYGTFAPAYIADENGRPMHSWRVLILPFLEQGKLYDQYDFNEPWDGPNNSKLAAEIPRVFQCTSNYARGQSLMTSYVAIVGPESAWPGEKTTTLGDIKDGTSNTILVVEVADSGIHWMEPRDFHVLQMNASINATAGQGISSKHAGGAHVGLADGTTRFVSPDWTPHTLKALFTISGGETIDWNSADVPVFVKPE